ncbi:hypothetical protein RLIN73S_01748 [Rhodanobacter lindaniclasticus]
MLDHAPRELQPVLDALNGQLRRLADALEREHRFSADVAHELRTPLASIMLNIESATATGDSAEAATSLAGARHNVAALARRVEQLLALARLESGTALEQRQSIDLVGVAIDVIEVADPGDRRQRRRAGLQPRRATRAGARPRSRVGGAAAQPDRERHAPRARRRPGAVVDHAGRGQHHHRRGRRRPRHPARTPRRGVRPLPPRVPPAAATVTAWACRSCNGPRNSTAPASSCSTRRSAAGCG